MYNILRALHPLRPPVSLLLIAVSTFVFSLWPHWWIVVFSCALTIPLWHTLRDTRDTRRPLEVATIPKIRGILPGNLDILWQLIYNETHEYCGETLRKWAEVYGPTYDMNILFGHQIITADPANVKHILANDFDSFGKGKKFHAMFDSFLGTGIFTTDGEAWRYHRAMARPFLSAERTSDFECFEKHTSKTLEAMLENASKDKPFDIQDLYSRFTLDTGTDFLFGHHVDSITQAGIINGQSDRPYSTFAEAFNTMSNIAMKRVRIGSTWRLFEMGQDPTIKPMKIINAFLDPIIQASMATRESNTDLRERSFLDHLIKSTEDPKVVRDELLNLLLAARDTTASLLTYVTYILALHPEVVRVLRSEIEKTVGQLNTPTISNIRQMKYLRAVLNETLRLFPPVPFNIRRCVKDSVLPSPLSKTGPFRISSGISITYSPLLIQRRRDLWGDSACIFDPQRWLHDAPKTHVTNPFAFLPFNGGPRMCLGQQFAYNECSYFVIRMLQTFQSIDLAPDAQPVHSRPPDLWSASTTERQSVEKCWPQASLTLYIKDGLWIRAKYDR